MLEFLKIVHFFGVVMGLGGGMANAMAAKRLAAVPPEALPAIRSFREALGGLSTLGLVLLWLSGIAMVAGWHGPALFAQPLFSLKIGAVIVLSAISLASNLTIRQARKTGTKPSAQHMRRLLMGSLVFATLALVLAVINFS